MALHCPLSPNAISLLALFVTLAAAAILARGAVNPVMFLVAPPVVALGGLLDAFDGIVARVQNRTSRFGDFLDHLFDRIADVALLGGWCIGANIRLDLALFTLSCIILFGYLGTQIEASFGKRTYEGTGRGEYVLTLLTLPMIAYIVVTTGLQTVRIGPLTINELVTALFALSAVLALFQRLRLAARYAREASSESGKSS